MNKVSKNCGLSEGISPAEKRIKTIYSVNIEYFWTDS